ncbi:uncharacterized protein L201_008044 [Kwoniella dendrophila CBS 6074]|uniref:Zn(2)-C6 fungal-type domain-containing protein n=1 Tax=Kwoniella dendrophila CBS 6074 TaxID=1295534 RepID=A0AAX4K7H6_9TREE
MTSEAVNFDCAIADEPLPPLTQQDVDEAIYYMNLPENGNNAQNQFAVQSTITAPPLPTSSSQNQHLHEAAENTILDYLMTLNGQQSPCLVNSYDLPQIMFTKKVANSYEDRNQPDTLFTTSALKSNNQSDGVLESSSNSSSSIEAGHNAQSKSNSNNESVHIKKTRNNKCCLSCRQSKVKCITVDGKGTCFRCVQKGYNGCNPFKIVREPRTNRKPRTKRK